MEDVAFRVLVPVDGSPVAEGVLATMHSLRSVGPLRATLLRVILPDESAEPALKYLEVVRAGLEKQGVPVETKTEWGRPAREILYASRGSGFNLIAMTTHGRTGLRRAFLGSVAEEVLRHSEVPMLVVRQGARSGAWKRIVVPLDGSSLAEKILPEAMRLARAFGSEIDLLRVTPSAVVQMTAAGHGGPLPEEDPMPYLRGLCDRLAKDGVTARAVARKGDAASEICRHAKELGAGAILVATHGRSGLKRMMMGSVAEHVLRAAPCPVYVLRTVEAPVAVVAAGS